MRLLLVPLWCLLAASSAMDGYTCPPEESAAAKIQQVCLTDNFDDAIFIDSTNNYFLYGNMVVKRAYTGQGTIAAGWPKPASELWPGVPAHVDAAFSMPGNRTYFFKGSQYWSYVGSALQDGFPKPIAEGFNGVPDNVDAADPWDSYIYFFKGNMYYRYSPCSNITYSSPITDFYGVWPSGIGGMMRHSNGYAYFFKGGVFIQYHVANPKGTVPPLQVTNTIWFGCKFNI